MHPIPCRSEGQHLTTRAPAQVPISKTQGNSKLRDISNVFRQLASNASSRASRRTGAPLNLVVAQGIAASRKAVALVKEEEPACTLQATPTVARCDALPPSQPVTSDPSIDEKPVFVEASAKRNAAPTVTQSSTACTRFHIPSRASTAQKHGSTKDDTDMRIHIDMLHMTLAHVEDERKKAAEEKSALAVRYAELEQRHSALKTACAVLSNEKRVLENERAALRREMAALKREHDGCEAEAEKAERRSEALWKEKAALVQDIVQREAERLQLAKKCEEVEKERGRAEELFSANVRLKRENQKLVLSRTRLEECTSPFCRVVGFR